jgi:hypothetical protein
MDFLDHAFDALLRWPVSQACLTGSRRIHPPKRISQEIELAVRDLADACLLLVDLSVGAEAGTNNSENNLAQAIRQGASNSISQTGQEIVQRQLNIQPTLTVRPGFPVRVIVTRDLLLTPYGQGGTP